jgi:hypothetical protein
MKFWYFKCTLVYTLSLYYKLGMFHVQLDYLASLLILGTTLTRSAFLKKMFKFSCFDSSICTYTNLIHSVTLSFRIARLEMLCAC